MSENPTLTIAQKGAALSVSLCSEGHVHLRIAGDVASIDVPFNSQEASDLAGALLQAAADARGVEQGGSAATH